MLNALNKINSEILKISLDQLIKVLWAITLFLSAFKNISIWKFFYLADNEYFKYPIIENFYLLTSSFVSEILYISLFSCLLLLSKNVYLKATPFILNGLINFVLQSSDYLALHHDMLLSSMLFIAYGIYIALGKHKWKSHTIKIILAITAGTYFLSGIVKIDPDFLSGEMAKAIIDRSGAYFYSPIMEFVANFSSLLSWFAMFVEILEPIFLLFFYGPIKLLSMLLAFPFHMGILLTGTGTVYNLIYPAAFLLIISEIDKDVLIKNMFIYKIYQYFALAFISFSILYITLMFYVLLK